MNGKKLQYEFTGEEANYLLTAVNRMQIAGVEAAKSLMHMVTLLKSPINSEELEKDQLAELKSKYEPKKEKK